MPEIITVTANADPDQGALVFEDATQARSPSVSKTRRRLSSGT
ncbi:MAG: hypothetical protein ACREPL_01280 [Rhodanobacteraceae bacterium]